MVVQSGLQKEFSISNELKQFIWKLLSDDPDNRPDFCEIMLHPWMHGSRADEDDIKKNLDLRREHIQKV